MTTRTRTRKLPKLDLVRMLAEAPKEPKPRTIAEIHAELGTFPFRVRKVASAYDGGIAIAVGDEREIVALLYDGTWLAPKAAQRIADTRSWILLGN